MSQNASITPQNNIVRKLLPFTMISLVMRSKLWSQCFALGNWATASNIYLRTTTHKTNKFPDDLMHCCLPELIGFFLFLSGVMKTFGNPDYNPGAPEKFCPAQDLEICCQPLRFGVSNLQCILRRHFYEYCWIQTDYIFFLDFIANHISRDS